ncbi:MAG: hypothetical protein NTV51_28160 [Verrucomicrobia bacterium]|nr:hypothetical protein [Verrucomicrobiota bacterium]
MRWARVIASARDCHAWLPWLLAATFVVAVEALGRRFALPAAERALVRAPVAGTVILLLAIRRHWNHDRTAFECVTVGALAPAAWLVGRTLGGPAQALPLLALGSTLPGYAAWRFAPDSGQHGALWPFRTLLHRPLLPLVILAGSLLLLAGCVPPRSASAISPARPPAGNLATPGRPICPVNLHSLLPSSPFP